MSLKTYFVSRGLERFLSGRRLEKRRRLLERSRVRRGAPHEIEYFHEPGDPYAALLVQLLPQLLERYKLRLKFWLVNPPADWAAPERAALTAYSRRDAAVLARKAGLSFADPGATPAREAVVAACNELGALVEGAAGSDVQLATLERVAQIEQSLWRGELMPAVKDSSEAARARGSARREKLGHYLGATLCYEKEWYWGIDRLHYLEQRLQNLGAGIASEAPDLLFAPPSTPAGTARLNPSTGLEFFLSFRSPYTWLATERVQALANAYGVPLRLRYVLPMVMRNLPVPRTKGLYIMQDAAREARRLGIPFGRIADPVGEPVERGYAILPWAIDEGLGYEFCESFLRGVWSEGVDAGSDRGLKLLVERAGLSWAAAKPLIGGNHWRAEAEANRLELMSENIWGVPSFRYGATSTWGQDRLWLMEDALQAATTLHSEGAP